MPTIPSYQLFIGGLVGLGANYLFKSILFRLFGLSFTFINPFTFSIHGLSYTPSKSKEISINIGRIKFHLTLFSKVKTYVRTTISDITINVKDFQVNNDNTSSSSSSNAKSITQFNDANEKENALESYETVELLEKLKNYKYDPNASVSIHSEDEKLNRLTKFLFKYLPHLSFNIENTTILLSSSLSVVSSKIVGNTDLNTSDVKVSYLKSQVASDHSTWLSSLNIDNFYLYNHKTDNIISKFCESISTSVSFKINPDTGIITSLEPKFRIVGVDLSILYILKIFKSFNSDFQFDIDDGENSQKAPRFKKISLVKMYIYGFFARLLRNANFSFQSVRITDIPIASTKKLNKFMATMNDDSLEDVALVSFSLDTLSFNIGPINPNQVGFSLKFVEDSFPLQSLITLTNFKLALDFTKMTKYTGKVKSFEVIAIPNLLFTMESTMMNNLLRVIFNHEEQDDFILKQTISIIQLTFANPSIDLSVEQLILLMKLFKKNKKAEQELHANGEGHDNNDNTKSLELTDIEKERKTRYINLVLETLPTVQINVLIEKPSIILRSDNENKSDRDMHLFIFQPSLLGMQLDTSASKTNMSLSFRFDIPETSLIYQRNNLNKSSVKFASIKDILFKLDCNMLPLKNMKTSLSFGSFLLNMTDLKVLNGLSIILNSLQLQMFKHKEPHKLVREPIKHRKENVQLLFRDLPDWFIEVKLSLGDIKVVLGSKSLFMPGEKLLDESDYENMFANDKVYTPSSIVFRIESIKLSVRAKDTKPESENDSDNMTLSGFSTKSKVSDDDYYWYAFNQIGEIQIKSYMQNPLTGVKQKEKLLSIPTINTTVYCLKSNVYEITNSIETIKIDFSVTSHFALFSAFYLIKNAMAYNRNKYFPDLNKKKEHDKQIKEHSKKLETDTPKAKFKLFNIKWHLKEAQVKLLMPTLFHLRIDMYDLKGSAFNNAMVMHHKLIRLSVKKTKDSLFYNKVMNFDNMKLTCQLPNKDHKLVKLTFVDSNIKISVPSNFVVHSLFDSIILFAKLTKKFIKSIKNGPTGCRDKASPSGVIHLPKMIFKSDAMSLNLEDDPLEAKIGMYYQLGLLEQAARLKKLEHFENFKKQLKINYKSILRDEQFKELSKYLDGLSSSTFHSEYNQIEDPDVRKIVSDCAKKLHILRVNISKSWFNTVEEFNNKRKDVVTLNMDFLIGILSSTLPVSDGFNADMVDFNDNPPLMGLMFNDFRLSIAPPKYKDDGGDVHEFLHRVGKGIPKDTVWDKIIPMRLVIKASEVRVHLRDLPLPLVYIPNSKSSDRWSNTFVFKSTLAIAEQFPQSDTEYYYLYIPMFENLTQGEATDKFYSWEAPKTITSVKTYYEIECQIDSDTPTMATWSTAYQALLRQVSLTFDTFSKISKDPSPKLGTWDKLRNILHGYIKFRWLNDSTAVRINILNSSNPYDILGIRSGFSLLFTDNVEWLINDPNRELERDYFIFRSNRIVFGTPNFLVEPLPCWCSRDLVFLQCDEPKFLLSSLYGYYLNTDLYFGDNPEAQRLYELNRTNIFKSQNICLDGDIELKLSMEFQRLSDGEKTHEFKSHFENVLCAPEFVEDKSNHDSYERFRSDYIHMSLGLTAKNSTNNILRLSPRALLMFFKWFKRFSDDPSLPIRTGNLWGSQNKSVKLGSHLMTFKFMFDIQPLYICHGYRIDLSKPENKTAISLKAKISSFKCDLHQRKEKKVKEVDFLDEKYSIMKMAFYIGMVALDDIDLRVIGLKFGNAVNPSSPKHNFEIFDNDQSWIDVNDYQEIDLPNIGNCDIYGQIYPLSHASNFCYWMNKTQNSSKFGNEDSHDCLINYDNRPDVKFNHIFDVNSLKVKWYRNSRNLIFEYLAELEFRAAYVYSTSFKARSAIFKKLQESADDNDHDMSKKELIKQEKSKIEIQDDESFEKALRNVSQYVSEVVPVDDMIVRLDDIQVQIMIDPTDSELILFRTQHNEIKIISLMDSDWFKYVKSANIAKRFGTIFKDADLLILSQKEFADLNIDADHYGTCSSWPVFLSGNEPSSFIKKKTLLSDVLFYFVFEKASNTYAGTKFRNNLYLNVPKFETKIDSESYLKTLRIIQKVMVYSSPQQKKFAEMVQAVSLATSDQTDKLFESLEKICNETFDIIHLYKALSAATVSMDELPDIDKVLHRIVSKNFTHSLLLSKIILLECDPKHKANDDKCFVEWVIKGDNINVVFTENDIDFLKFAVEDFRFSRLEMLDKSTENEILVDKIAIFNQDYDILYPELLAPYKENKESKVKEMIKINWNLGEKIGGMNNVRDVKILCHPMKLSIEQKTGDKLMKFLFPNDIEYSDDKDVSDDESDDESETESETEDNMDDGSLEDYLKQLGKRNSRSISRTSIDTKSDGNFQISPTELFNGDDAFKDALYETKKADYVPSINIQHDDNGNDNTNAHYKNAKKDIESYFSSSDDSDDAEMESLLNDRSALKKMNSKTSMKTNISKATNNIRSEYSTKLNKRIVDSKLINTSSAIEELMKGQVSISDMSEDPKNLLEISDRAKKYMNISRLEFENLLVNITFSGKGKLRLINVTNLSLTIPKFVVKRKLWTKIDLINAIKKHFIKTILKQSGRLIKNKLFVFKKKKRLNKLRSVKGNIRQIQGKV